MRDRGTPKEYLAAYRRIKQLLPGGLVTVEAKSTDDGAISGSYETYTSVETWSAQRLVRELFDKVDYADLIEMKNYHDLECQIEEAYEYHGQCHVTFIRSDADYEKHRIARERERFDQLAQHLASSSNIAVGSLEFIDLIYRKIKECGDRQFGLKEDGLCIGYGVTPEQWQEEFNGFDENKSNLYDLLGWIKQACPLVWMQYEQRRLEREGVTREQGKKTVIDSLFEGLL